MLQINVDVFLQNWLEELINCHHIIKKPERKAAFGMPIWLQYHEK